MSIKVMSLVWDNFKDGGTPKLVFLAMADWCNDSGGKLYPSVATVASKCSISEKQARRVIHNLIERGYMTVTLNSAGGRRQDTRHYQINLSMITPPPDVTPPVDVTPPLGGSIPLPYRVITPPSGGSQDVINHHISKTVKPVDKSTEKPKDLQAAEKIRSIASSLAIGKTI